MAHAHKPLEGTLYLARIDEDFDPETDVALDPWCFVGHEDVYSDWRQLDFIDPFPDIPDIQAEHAKIRPWVTYLVERLASQLNAYHGTEYSSDFWRSMLAIWLVELTQRVWKHFVLIERLIEKLGDRPMRATVWTDAGPWPFVTTGQVFQALMYDEKFNWWIDSQILSVLAPDHWRLIETDDAPDPVDHVTPLDTSVDPKGLSRLIRRFKQSLGYTDFVGTRWRGLALAVYTNLLPRHSTRHRIQPDTDFVPEDVFPDKFIRVFEGIMQATLPRAYREEFHAYGGAAARHTYKPGRIRIGTLSNWNEKERFFAAFAHEAGEKLTQAQHGGGYGAVAIHLKPGEIEFRNDAFFSWGWTENADYDGRIIPLPSPLLSRMADSHREMRSELIVVGDAPRFRKPRIDQRPRDVDFFRSGPDTVTLIEGLDEQIRADTVFRDYSRAATDVDILQYIRDRFPNLPALTGDLHKRLMACRLTILQAPGTTMNIAMAANVPTVCVWDREFNKVCPQAQPFFDALKDVGILFHDEAAAANHVNAVWDDIDGWWQRDTVQKARRDWCHQFARADRFWWWQWAKTLTGLARET